MTHFKAILLLTTFYFFSVNLPVYSDSTQWLAFGKIDTPQKLWHSLTNTIELAPVYKAALKVASNDDYAKVLIKELHKKPALQALDKVWYFALAKSPNSNFFSAWSIWHENKEKNRELFISGNQLINSKTEFPEIFAQLNSQNEIEFRFEKLPYEELEKTLQNYLQQQNQMLERRCLMQKSRIKRELQKHPDKIFSEKKINSCPLNGTYRIDKNSSEITVTCNHSRLTASYSNDDNEAVIIGIALIEILKETSSFKIVFDDDNKIFSFELNYSSETSKHKKHLNTWASSINWFTINNAASVADPISNFQIISTIPVNHLFKILLAHSNEFKILENQLPELALKPFCIELFGGPPRYKMIGPIKIKVPLKFEILKQLINKMENKSLPFTIKKQELLGREALSIKPSPQASRFKVSGNYQIKFDEFYIFASHNNETLVALGGDTAIQTLMTESGESATVNIWNDLKEEHLKFAIAYRLDLLAKRLLYFANIFLWGNEQRACSSSLSNWIRNNQQDFINLNQKDELPESLKKCCPRDGIVIFNNRKKVGCAIHNYQNLDRIKTQLFSANIPIGRWLRIYLRKTSNGSEIIFDIKHPQEGKNLEK
ncbi:MAG: hypothetical protein ACQETH_09270 [Candidatus Rifleibacteriota bacterium]